MLSTLIGSLLSLNYTVILSVLHRSYLTHALTAVCFDVVSHTVWLRQSTCARVQLDGSLPVVAYEHLGLVSPTETRGERGCLAAFS